MKSNEFHMKTSGISQQPKWQRQKEVKWYDSDQSGKNSNIQCRAMYHIFGLNRRVRLKYGKIGWVAVVSMLSISIELFQCFQSFENEHHNNATALHMHEIFNLSPNTVFKKKKKKPYWWIWHGFFYQMQIIQWMLLNLWNMTRNICQYKRHKKRNILTVSFVLVAKSWNIYSEQI